MYERRPDLLHDIVELVEVAHIKIDDLEGHEARDAKVDETRKGRTWRSFMPSFFVIVNVKASQDSSSCPISPE